MTDQLPGLGWLPSPLDERDFPIDQLYALRGIEKETAPPAEYICPGELPPISDQGSTPQCVAHGSSGMKGYEDRIDQGQFFPWNRPLFFTQIGGGPNGAFVRNAFDRMLKYGYPVLAIDDAANHKIANYYAVLITQAEMQAALMAFGPLVIGMDWDGAFDSPPSSGVLRKPSGYVRGGHCLLFVGWRVIGGVTCWILRNSWGTGWGVNGECYLPFAYLTAVVGEAWKAVDAIENPPEPYTPRTSMSTVYITPVRILDTRILKNPLIPGDDRDVLVCGVMGIPPNAVGVSGNFTFVDPTQAGWLALTPTKYGPGPTSSANFVVGQKPNANGFNCGLATNGTLSVHNGSLGTVGVILDITSYDLA
jgi:hypothetical protein